MLPTGKLQGVRLARGTRGSFPTKTEARVEMQTKLQPSRSSQPIPSFLLLLLGALSVAACGESSVETSGSTNATDGNRFGAAGFSTSIEESPGYEAFQAGTKFKAEGLLDRAAEELYRAVELDRYRPEFLYEFATVLVAMHLPGDARTMLTRGIQLDPKNVDMRILFALLEVNTRQPQQAVKHLRSALEIDESRHEAHFLLGRTLAYLSDATVGSRTIDQETLAESIRELERAIELDPDNTEYYYWAAKAYERKADLETALTYYEKSASLDPKNPGARIEASELLLAQGELDKAEKLLTEVQKITKDDPRVYSVLGNLHQQREDFAEARAAFERSIELDPTRPESHFALANVLSRLGEEQLAEKRREEHEYWLGLHEQYNFWTAESKANPNDADTAVELGAVCYLLHDNDQAMGWFRRAIDLKRDHPLAHAYIGKIVLAMGETDVAIAHLEESLKAGPDNLEVVRKLVEGLLQKGDLEQAGLRMKKVLELAPEDAKTHYNYGVLCLQTDRMDEALTHFERAIAIDENYVDARLALAGVLYEKKDWDRAIEHYQRILSIVPDHADAARFLQMAREAKG